MRHRIDRSGGCWREERRLSPTFTRTGSRRNSRAICSTPGIHRGREHQRLALFRHHPHDPAQLRQEAHVEHPVGFVDHHEPDSIELDACRARDGRSGGRDRRSRPARRCASRESGGSSIRRPRSPPSAGACCAKAGRTRGRSGPPARGSAPGSARAGAASPRLRMEAVKQREQKGGGLAAAGFGSGDQIASGQGHRNRAGLNWGWMMMAAVADRA